MSSMSDMLRSEARTDKDALVSDADKVTRLSRGKDSSTYVSLSEKSSSGMNWDRESVLHENKDGIRWKFSKKSWQRIQKASGVGAGAAAAAGRKNALAKAAALSGAAKNAGAAVSELLDGDDADADSVGAKASAAATETVRKMASKRAKAKKPVKPLPPTPGAAPDLDAVGESAPRNRARSPRPKGGEIWAGSNNARIARDGARAASGSASAQFARKQAAKIRKQAIWRESVNKQRAAKTAIKSAQAAKAAREASVAAASAASSVAHAVGAPIAVPIAATATITAALAAVIIAVLFALMSIFTTVTTTTIVPSLITGNGGSLAEAALAEYESGPHSGGSPYWGHCGFGARVEWCSCFVKYCWDKCGYDETLGSPSGVGMANSWIIWAHDNPDKASMFANDSNYKPQPGDILVIGSLSVSTHVGICVSELRDDGTFECVEGNYGDAIAKTTYYPGSVWDYVCRPKYPSPKMSFGFGGGETYNGAGELMEGVNFNMSESAFVAHWSKRIDDYISSKAPGSPLVGHGETYARCAYRAHFDPRYLPAVAGAEQSFGAVNPNLGGNYYGWGVFDSGIVSAAYAGGDSIDQWIAYLLSDKALLAGKPIIEYSSLEEIQSAPWATGSGWLGNVRQFMSEM